jgi:hypothetical protein
MTNWPDLPLSSWRDTRDTLHMWTQIVGKIRLKLTPLINHWWNVTLYVTSSGLTTSAMYSGDRCLTIDFDFVAHVLRVRVSDGREKVISLEPKTVARFYGETMQALDELNVPVRIYTTPSEVADPIPFERDDVHRSYDREFVERFWHALALTSDVFTNFRAKFIGKSSPVHFFWGSFDLAVTRFSGRRAPERPEVDAMTREAYSHEVSSVGFWPGDERGNTTYYSYAAPEPDGFRATKIHPAETYFNETLGGFYLPYDAVRNAADPAATLLMFCEDTYNAAANCGNWDRAALERHA